MKYQIKKRTTTTVKIPDTLSSKAVTTNLKFKLWDINLNGLNALNNLKILKTPRSILVKIESTSDMITIMKSNYDHVSRRYEFVSKTNPKALKYIDKR